MTKNRNAYLFADRSVSKVTRAVLKDAFRRTPQFRSSTKTQRQLRKNAVAMKFSKTIQDVFLTLVDKLITKINDNGTVSPYNDENLVASLPLLFDRVKGEFEAAFDEVIKQKKQEDQTDDYCMFPLLILLVKTATLRKTSRGQNNIFQKRVANKSKRHQIRETFRRFIGTSNNNDLSEYLLRFFVNWVEDYITTVRPKLLTKLDNSDHKSAKNIQRMFEMLYFNMLGEMLFGLPTLYTSFNQTNYMFDDVFLEDLEGTVRERVSMILNLPLEAVTSFADSLQTGLGNKMQMLFLQNIDLAHDLLNNARCNQTNGMLLTTRVYFEDFAAILNIPENVLYNFLAKVNSRGVVERSGGGPAAVVTNHRSLRGAVFANAKQPFKSFKRRIEKLDSRQFERSISAPQYRDEFDNFMLTIIENLSKDKENTTNNNIILDNITPFMQTIVFLLRGNVNAGLATNVCNGEDCNYLTFRDKEMYKYNQSLFVKHQRGMYQQLAGSIVGLLKRIYEGALKTMYLDLDNPRSENIGKSLALWFALFFDKDSFALFESEQHMKNIYLSRNEDNALHQDDDVVSLMFGDKDDTLLMLAKSFLKRFIVLFGSEASRSRKYHFQLFCMITGMKESVLKFFMQYIRNQWAGNNIDSTVDDLFDKLDDVSIVKEELQSTELSPQTTNLMHRVEEDQDLQEEARTRRSSALEDAQPNTLDNLWKDAQTNASIILGKLAIVSE